MATAEIGIPASGLRSEVESDDPPKASPISRAFAWTFFGRALYGACQWGILSVLAKLGDTVLVGRFALALAVTAPLSVFTNLQLRSIYATDIHDEFSWATYWRLRTRLSVVCFLVLVLFVLTSPSLRDDAWTIGIVAAAKAVEMVEDLLYGVFQRHRQMQYFGRSLALRGVATLVAFGATLALGLPLEVCVGAMLAIWVAVLLFYDAPRALALRTPSKPTPQTSDRGRRLLWLALPMGLVMLLDSLNQNVPRYFVEWLDGSSQLGIYVAMAYVIQAGGTVVFALGAPLASAMARDYAEHRGTAFTRRAVGLLLITVAIGVSGVLFASLAGRPFLRLVYSEQFAAAADVFVWVMTGAAFHYVILMCNNVLMASRLLRVQAVIWGVVLLATTGAAQAFVPLRGILGAAQAFTLGVAIGSIVAVASVAVVIQRIRRTERTV